MADHLSKLPTLVDVMVAPDEGQATFFFHYRPPKLRYRFGLIGMPGGSTGP